MNLGGEMGKFWGYIPPGGVFGGAVLSFLIPFVVYKVNQLLHKYGDPPWKTGKEQEEREK